MDIITETKTDSDTISMMETRRANLARRIQQLRSKQKGVGPFRAAGIQRSMDSIRNEIKEIDHMMKIFGMSFGKTSEQKPKEKVYLLKYEPKEDMTAYELSQIPVVMQYNSEERDTITFSETERRWNNTIPDNVKRHWKIIGEKFI